MSWRRCLILAAFSLSGCDCSDGGGGGPCASSEDCPSGQRCIDMACVPDSRVDAGPPRDGGGMDAGGCSRDEDCGGGVCVGGRCCGDREAVCGSDCCESAEVCL